MPAPRSLLSSARATRGLRAASVSVISSVSWCGLKPSRSSLTRASPAAMLEQETYDYARRVTKVPAQKLRLEKTAINRAMDLRGFRTTVLAGAEFDAIVLAGGAEHPRDLDIPGRELKGIHYAMEFLPQQNRRCAGDTLAPDADILATGKRVVIIGGGDTGADCLGTCHRQKPLSVHQFEIMPKPPEERSPR